MDSSPAADRERLSQQAFGHLVRVVHLVGQGGAQELRQHDLTPAQYQLMLLVHRKPGSTQQELTSALGVTKGNISQLVTRLEDAGLMDRDRRGASSQLILTDRGSELVRQLIPDHRRFLAAQFVSLSDDELRQFAAAAATLSTSLYACPAG